MAGDVFEALSESLGFPGSRYLRDILEYVMTPSQADVVQALPGTIALRRTRDEIQMHTAAGTHPAGIAGGEP